MIFSRYFKAAIVLLALLVASSWAAPKKVSAKVRSRIGGPGDVTCQKEGKGNWDDVQVGQKISQGSRIRTLVESQVTLNLPDGSTISIEENSLVEMSQLMSEDGANITTASIQNGKVRFDAQKQKQGSEFKFKTGTATAAIRGTSGSVGSTPRGTVASLASGVMDLITNSGVKATITAGQTAITNGEDEIKLFDLTSSGDPEFFNVIEALMADTTLSTDSLIKLINTQDSAYKENFMNKAGLKCITNTLPDTIYEPSVNLSVKCDAAFDRFEVAGAITKENDGNLKEINANWSSVEIGPKKFPITCVAKNIKLPCGELSTYYAGTVKATAKDSVVHVPLTLSSPSDMLICDPGVAVIEGKFDPSDPKANLTISFGKTTSHNLVPSHPDGEFSYPITINDKAGNWNETKIDVEYKSEALKVNEKASVSIEVNKSCKSVNLERPTITFLRSDSLKCNASVNIGNVSGDKVILTHSIDGNDIKDTYFDSDVNHTFNLVSGSHQYTFKVKDQAGNESSLSKTMGCYPPTNVSLEISGGNKFERQRSPMPPGSISPVLYRQMHFKVTGIPQNNPIYIKQISISQDGKSPITLKLTDFQSTSFDHQIELIWGKRSNVKIDVIMKSGKMLTLTKTYLIE
ncbi:MAG: FecR domain-containing protein [Fibrobacter sp.]|nr:FecR domain-containing protein [Fibrobacter sp.]